MGQLRPSNDLFAINLWLPRHLHNLQVVHRLDQGFDAATLSSEHAHINVLVSGYS